MPRRPVVPALALALTLTGCALSSQPTEAPDQPGATTPPAPSNTATKPAKPTPSPTNQGVRKLSLADLEWVDVLRKNAKVQLKGGKAIDGEFTYELANERVWSDADGDGQEDVLGLITRTKGTQKVTQAYVWRYDPQAKKVTQVLDPLGDWNPCGDMLKAVRPGTPNGFEIDEIIRDRHDNQKCGTTPLHPRTRTVVVSSGRLVMTKPFLAYGGICYATYDTATTFTRDVPIRIAPDAAADVVDTQRTFYAAIPDSLERELPAGWLQVGWVTDKMKAQQAYWGICGFVWGL